MEGFVEAIQIADNVTSIMKLPCVTHCFKAVFSGHEKLVYKLTNHRSAFKGDWIVKDKEGRWDVIRNEEYEKAQPY